MASFVDQFSKCVVFLFSEVGGTPVGTGFLCGYPTGNDRPGEFVPLVVTAKHIVDNRRSIVARYSMKTGTRPGAAVYDLAELRRTGDYWEHNDPGVDIAVFRTQAFTETEVSSIPLDLVASRDDFSR